MDEDYSVIRGALLSLICVGDEIYHIFNDLDGVARIRLCTVVAIIDNESLRIDAGNTGWISTQYYEAIEVYNGRPYIWNNPNYSDNTERLKKIGDIIESDDTMYEYF
jgi:hypothetical protein